MFDTFRHAWDIKEVRKKILYTLLLIVIYRLGCYIPVPNVNPQYISQQVSSINILSFLDLMSGGAFGNFTIFAMGISPYINASIIMNLLTVALPPLERMSKDGEDGRKKIEKITRIVGIGFAFIMSIGIVLGLGPNAVLPSTTIPIQMSYITIGIVITAGTAFLMWLGEKITAVGIGNGTSFIIFAGIVSRVPSSIISVVTRTFTGDLNLWILPIVTILILAIIAVVTYMDLGVRKVPVQYSKRVVGRKMYGGQSTHIPMKVNANGVLPLIFAMTIMQFPSIIVQFWPDSAFSKFFQRFLGAGSVWYFVIYALLIVLFAFFYTAITFNPVEMSKNMQANGGFIPGIRPGKATSDYLGRISNRLTFFSAIFLSIIAAVPTLFTSLLGAGATFGATSVLIMVSIALETNKTLEAQISMRHYKGFLKK